MTENDRQALLQEKVEDSELWILLDRLGEQEMGGSELPTLGAVAEATGAAPEELAKLLVQIRHEAVDAHFGEILEQHEERISLLEEPGRSLDLDDRYVKKPGRGYYLYVLFLIIVLTVFIVSTERAKARRGESQQSPERPTRIMGSDGREYYPR